MTQLTNNLEGGTDGVAISTANSGGISGNAFDSVFALGGNVCAYSSTQAKGTLSAQMQNNSANVTGLFWAASYADITEDYGRIYLYMEDWPRAGFTHWFIQFLSAAGAVQGGLQIMDTGKIRAISLLPSSTVTDSTSALATDTWHRLEWKFTCRSNLTVKFFADDSASTSQADVSRAMDPTAPNATIGEVRIGILAAATDLPTASGFYYLDNIVTGATAYPGPATVPTSFARPTADVSDGAWLTDAGGTSLFSVIDETPFSDADYIVSGLSPSGADECKIEVGALTDPGVGTGHTIRYRYMKDIAAGDRIDLTVNLYRADGTTLVRAQTHTDIPATITPAQFTLTTTEADSIPTGDYASGLILGFSAIKV